MREVREGAERGREVLQQRVPEAVALARAVPDQLLLGAGAHLHGGGEGAVARDRPVVVAVGADEVGEHARIAPIRLPAADLVTFAVERRHPRVDRVDPVARADERCDPRAAVGLDANHDLACVLWKYRTATPAPSAHASRLSTLPPSYSTRLNPSTISPCRHAAPGSLSPAATGPSVAGPSLRAMKSVTAGTPSAYSSRKDLFTNSGAPRT